MAPRFDPLDGRYGTRPAWQRAAVLGVAGVLVLAFVLWVLWAAWFHSTPSVESELASWDVVDTHQVHATIDVHLDDGVRAHCVVQAMAVDHSVVGEVTFVPHDGSNDIDMRTERKATSVSLEGCTAPGQTRPR